MPTAGPEDMSATPTAETEHVSATPTAETEHVSATPTARPEDTPASKCGGRRDVSAVTARCVALLAFVVVLASSCGNDGGRAAVTAAPPAETTTASETKTAPPTTSAPTTTTPTTSAPTTTSAAEVPETTAAPVPEDSAASDSAGSAGAPTADDGAEAALNAWAVVFDSSADFSSKLKHLEDGDSLEASNAAYAAGGERMGGISLEPTAAEVDGDVATVTYNVLFGGAAAYQDLKGTLELVEGTWVVSRESYCGFLASARTPC